MSQHGLRVKPGIFASIYGRFLCSNLHFRKPEKSLEGEELCVRPTHVSASRYQVMVNSLGILSGQKASLVSQSRQFNS